MPTRSMRQPWGTNTPNRIRPSCHSWPAAARAGRSCHDERHEPPPQRARGGPRPAAHPRHVGRGRSRRQPRPHGIPRVALAPARARHAPRAGAPQRRTGARGDGLRDAGRHPGRHGGQGRRLLRQQLPRRRRRRPGDRRARPPRHRGVVAPARGRRRGSRRARQGRRARGRHGHLPQDRVAPRCSRATGPTPSPVERVSPDRGRPARAAPHPWRAPGRAGRTGR